MSNTCHSTLALRGPVNERGRFAADVGAVEPWRFFEPHAPSASGEPNTCTWGTSGVKYAELARHDAARTEYALGTSWSPPYRWFEGACQVFPLLRWELFLFCVESGYAGYMLGEHGQLLTCERTESDIVRFFSERGRPGFFMPWWETAEPGAAEEPPTMAELDEADMAEALPSIREVG